MSSTINSEDLSVSGLFGAFYVVPSYQREYVWTEEDVEILLDDVRNEQRRLGGELHDYFIGSIVVAPHQEQAWEVIDGQQRLTTLTIALCAIRDRLVALEAPMESIPQHIAAIKRTRDGTEKRVDRLELQYEDAQGTLSEIIAQTERDNNRSLTSSQSAMIEAYEVCRTFLDGELGGDPTEIKKFTAFLLDHVKLIRIETASVGQALWIFETVNARGQSLEASDLLKNLLFRNAEAHQFQRLKTKWKTLIDGLDSADERTMRFIRYHVLAQYKESRLIAADVYRWLRNNAAGIGIESDPVGFADRLLRDASVYTRGVQGVLPNGEKSEPLSEILLMSRSARQHMVLVLAAAAVRPVAEVGELARHLERLLFIFNILRRPKNYFESRFASWASEIHKEPSAPLRESIFPEILAEIDGNREQFRVAFRELDESQLPKYRLKFILARLARELDARGQVAQPLSAYLDRRVEVEHAVPRMTAEPTVLGLGPEADLETVIGSIGNLSLLEKSLNASVKNRHVDKKAQAYRESRFLLTKSMAGDVGMGSPKTKPSQAITSLPPIIPWSFKALESRAAALADLACEIWAPHQ